MKRQATLEREARAVFDKLKHDPAMLQLVTRLAEVMVAGDAEQFAAAIRAIVAELRAGNRRRAATEAALAHVRALQLHQPRARRARGRKSAPIGAPATSVAS